MRDCGSHVLQAAAAKQLPGSAVGIAAVVRSELQAEEQMQACQAADKGPPAAQQPIVIPLYWTAGRVCRGGRCAGGAYSASLVRKQLAFVNNVWSHAGIRFSWEGVIHSAVAEDPRDISVCESPEGRCWACRA